VFGFPDGRPFNPDRFSREFDRRQSAYNRDHPEAPLPRLTLHGLRHTWATIALEAGIPVKIVSERLGHASTTITNDVYAHVTPTMGADAAEQVASLIFHSARSAEPIHS
jgi:integrase